MMLAGGQCASKRNPTDDFLLDSAGSRFVQTPLCHLKDAYLRLLGTSANCDLITEVAEFPLCWEGVCAVEVSSSYPGGSYKTEDV